MNDVQNPNSTVQRLTRLLTVRDVQRILNISRSHAYKLIQDGTIPSIRIGKLVRVQLVDLEKFIHHNLVKG